MTLEERLVDVKRQYGVILTKINLAKEKGYPFVYLHDFAEVYCENIQILLESGFDIEGEGGRFWVSWFEALEGIKGRLTGQSTLSPQVEFIPDQTISAIEVRKITIDRQYDCEKKEILETMSHEKSYSAYLTYPMYQVNAKKLAAELNVHIIVLNGKTAATSSTFVVWGNTGKYFNINIS